MGAPKNTTSTGQPAKYSDDVGTLFVGTLIALDGTLNVTGGIKATGVLTSVGLEVNIDGAAGTNRDLEWSTTPLSDRWIARANSTAEGGANAGSDWALIAFDDTGALLGNAITVVRSTQAVTIVTGLTVAAGGLTVSAGTASFAGNVGIFGAVPNARLEVVTGVSEIRVSFAAASGGILQIRGNTAGDSDIQLNAYSGTALLNFRASGGGVIASLTNAGLLTVLNGVIITNNGLTITAGGLTVSAGPVTFPLGGGTGIVTAGAADSAGAGFRLLRVPN